MQSAYNTDKTVPISFILSVQRDFCPKNSQKEYCIGENGYSKPDLSFAEDRTTVLLPNETLESGGFESGQGLQGAADNLFQVMHAAIRLDLGNVKPNNLLVNSSALGAIVHVDGNDLQSSLSGGGNELFKYPVYYMDETKIDVQFECRFQYAKSWSQILISVFVATVSMLGSAWAGFMQGATYLATRKEPKGEFQPPTSRSVYGIELSS